MRIGLFLGENTAPGESLDTHIARVQQAERDGFSSAWFTQEFGLDALTGRMRNVRCRAVR